MIDIEAIIKAAQIHGRDSEPDHEAGDLQDALRLAINAMTSPELAVFFATDAVGGVFETALTERPAQIPDADAMSTLLCDLAYSHAEDEGADVEIGDLQQLLRGAWAVMSEPTRAKLAAEPQLIENVEEWRDPPAPGA